MFNSKHRRQVANYIHRCLNITPWQLTESFTRKEDYMKLTGWGDPTSKNKHPIIILFCLNIVYF